MQVTQKLQWCILIPYTQNRARPFFPIMSILSSTTVLFQEFFFGKGPPIWDLPEAPHMLGAALPPIDPKPGPG